MSVYAQHGYAVRFDWGLRGAQECAPGSSVVAVVDVLSFTTATTVAVERGIDVLPYRWRDESAVAYAAEHRAELAVGRSAARPGQISLSPVTLQAAQGIDSVVLPSPNGSTISQYVAGLGCAVVAVSLRNASAAAKWVRAQEGVVTVIAGGESWPGGELRPGVEDLWGAGAFLAALDAQELSPEAGAALGAFKALGDVREGLLGCAGGRELVALGYQQDVEIAGEYDVAQVVPVLRDGRFVDMAKALP
ncbi:2-phosphosulfolactate phosphatase [Kribbella sp. NBC_01245]|uniref:2-phosphosulfolactate phosphatase n=1 Tax=Kribbella sp. NBC_01245 TaxID=2903578 RepID=UPI002E2879D2|nr:2-phosphosulfolactate phosphatase [Kribbella sp. NBC_01245]